MGEHFTPHILFGANPMWFALVLLCVTYAVIIWDRVNRAIIALVAAGVAVLSGALDQAEALKGIDWNTIGTLTGLMIITSIAQRSGVFQYAAIRAAQIARAHPAILLLLVQVVTFVLSAILNNVSTVLLMAPVTLAVTRELQIAPFPFLFAEVLASNIGGTATLIGDPPNLMIGSQAGLSFNDFIVHLAPVVVVVQIVQLLMAHWMWGRATHATAENRLRVMTMDARAAIVDVPLLLQSIAVLFVVVVALIFEDRLRLQPATVAMGGAAVLMLLDNWEHHSEKQTDKVTQTFTEVEWITIFFFVGLFIIVHAVEVSGLLQLLAAKLVAVTGNNIAVGGTIILWLSALLAAVIDNIPFVAVMIPVIKSMAPAYGGPEHIAPLWWCLSLGACLGGNGTLIGATANLTVAGVAERNGVAFGFVKFTLYALPMMIVSILICQVYVWL
ncbi:MAG TPA: ArsB/NhaD family transporter, partial [Xanthobacteraceae bacterium]|nr:ArsB/NhaD family transporter [Xanthobacteraceae bacterium]